jgi:hypothetical protein
VVADVEVDRFGLVLRVLRLLALLVLLVLLVLVALAAVPDLAVPDLLVLLLRVDVDDFGALVDFLATRAAFFAERLEGRRAAFGALATPS